MTMCLCNVEKCTFEQVRPSTGLQVLPVAKYLGDERVPVRPSAQVATRQNAGKTAAPRLLIAHDHLRVILKKVSHIFGQQNVRIDVRWRLSTNIYHRRAPQYEECLQGLIRSLFACFLLNLGREHDGEP